MVLALNRGTADEDANIDHLNVSSITITASFKGTTPEGIGIGNSKQEVKSTYPNPEISEFWNTYEYKGISYAFDDSDEVIRIFVFD